MADEASTGLDIQKFIKEGLTSGLKGAAMSTGKYVLGQALLAAGVEPDLLKSQDEKVQEKILGELAVLKEMVSDVEKRLDGLSSEITSQTQDLKTSIKAEGLRPSMETIDSLMIRLCGVFDDGTSDCFRLSLFQSSYPTTAARYTAATRPSPAQLKKIATAIENDVEKAMFKIANGLVGSPSDTGYLDSLTDFIVLQLDAGKGSLFGWYRYLEQRNLEYVTELLYGMILKVNSVSYLEDGFDPDRPSASADNAVDWLKKTYKGLIGKVVSQFEGSVERLVLSRYKPSDQGPEPGFPSQDQLHAIFSRVDLLGWMLTTEEVNETDPGIMVRRFLRSSQITENKSPELRPAYGYQASRGLLVGIPGAYNGGTGGARMSHWYRCVDLLESDGFMTLMPAEKSNIRIARYHWAWSPPPPPSGASVGTDFFAPVVARLIDKKSFLEVDKRGPDTVLLASYVDSQPILENLCFSPISPVSKSGNSGRIEIWEHESLVDDSKKYADADELLTKVQIAASCRRPPYRAALASSVRSGQSFYSGSGPARWKFKLKRNVLYQGNSREITVLVGGRLKVKIPQEIGVITTVPRKEKRHPNVKVMMEIKALSFPSVARNNDRDDDPIRSLHEISYDNTKRSCSIDEELVLRERFQLQGGQYNTLQWRVYLTALRQSTDSVAIKVKGQTEASGEHEIAYFRYAWDQPKLK